MRSNRSSETLAQSGQAEFTRPEREAQPGEGAVPGSSPSLCTSHHL